ncbi:MAG: SseB family protein [Legionellaceae bacterium]|nr:SseB family protein [Legionellaceae bacterium]
MNALEQAIIAAKNTAGQAKEANKAYLEFIKANFMMPLDRQQHTDQPRPLYLVEGDSIYVPVFSNQADFDAWAGEIQHDIQVLRLSGVDLLKGIGDDVHLCFNIGSPSYKLFLPAEIARMRSIIMKFFSNR